MLLSWLDQPLFHRLGLVLLHSLWQFVLLAVLLAGASEVLRRRSANLRYLVGCFALAAMLAVSALWTVAVTVIGRAMRMRPSSLRFSCLPCSALPYAASLATCPA